MHHTSKTAASWEIEVFFDGDCPLCLREIGLLRRLDRRGRIRFTDIAAPTFSPGDLGHDMAWFMDEIRGRLPDGSPVSGVEVFRRLYAAVGLGPVVALTRLPGIAQGLEVAYRLFARNRLRLTGRCPPSGCALPAGARGAG